MEYTRETIPGFGYDSITWIRDNEGHELSCTLDTVRNVKSLNELTEHERNSCTDVSQIIGTERW